MNVIRQSIRFIGMVQGVGFRYRSRHAARLTGVTGWVRNEYDGTVTMEIQGTKPQIEETLQRIMESRYMRIDRMDVKKIDVVENETTFSVAY